MRVLKILSFVGAMIAGTTAANAVPVSAGPTINMTATVIGTTDRTEFAFTDFIIGETLNIAVLMDGTITTTGGTSGVFGPFNRFFSTTGSFTFTGKDSGTTLTLNTGVEAFVRAGRSFLRSIDETGIWLNSSFDIDLDSGLFAPTSDFATYLAQFTGGETGTTFSSVRTAAGEGLRFDNTTVIPLPAGGLLLLGGLGALALRRKIAA